LCPWARCLITLSRYLALVCIGISIGMRSRFRGATLWAATSTAQVDCFAIYSIAFCSCEFMSAGIRLSGRLWFVGLRIIRRSLLGMKMLTRNFLFTALRIRHRFDAILAVGFLPVKCSAMRRSTDRLALTYLLRVSDPTVRRVRRIALVIVNLNYPSVRLARLVVSEFVFHLFLSCVGAVRAAFTLFLATTRLCITKLLK